MAVITRRGRILPVSRLLTLATADDLNGTVDGTQNMNVSGATRVIYFQEDSGTAGTAGIDVIEVSKDGGTNWSLDTTLMAVSPDAASSNDATGDIVAGAALNAAGVEPVDGALFKGGPYEGATLVRCGRGGAGAGGTAWVTGAPAVKAFIIGGPTGVPATS